MRLFVAVVPPEEALAHLANAVERVRPLEPALRWAEPQRWHLTLAFLGEVGEEVLPELSERLARAAARHPAHRLALEGAGRFGQRVLWVGVGRDAGLLPPLAASVAAAARRCGIAMEERPYRPHVTVARARERTRPDLRPLVTALAPYAGPPFPVDRIVLVRSHLGPRPSYDDVASWPLDA